MKYAINTLVGFSQAILNGLQPEPWLSAAMKPTDFSRSVVKFLKVKNISEVIANYSLLWEGDNSDGNLNISVETAQFTLSPGESKRVKIRLGVNTNVRQGFLSSKIVVSSNEHTYTIPLLAMVEPLDYPLLQITILTMKTIIFSIIFDHTRITFRITDPNSNLVFEEELFLKTGEYSLPFNLEKGQYILQMDVKARPAKYYKTAHFEYQINVK